MGKSLTISTLVYLDGCWLEITLEFLCVHSERAPECRMLLLLRRSTGQTGSGHAAAAPGAAIRI